jgi:hypothetical protein
MRVGIYGMDGNPVAVALAAAFAALGHSPIWRNPKPYGPGQVEKFDAVATYQGAPNAEKIRDDYERAGIQVFFVESGQKPDEVVNRLLNSDGSKPEPQAEPEPEPRPKPEIESEPEPDYGTLGGFSVKKLREYAKDNGIPLGKGVTLKADVVKAMYEAGVRGEHILPESSGEALEHAENQKPE